MMISWTLEQWSRLIYHVHRFNSNLKLTYEFSGMYISVILLQNWKKNGILNEKMSTAKFPDSQICCQLRSKPPNQVAFYPLQTKQLLPLPSEPAVLQVVWFLLLSSLEERLRIFKHGWNIFQLKKLHYSSLFNIKWVSLYINSKFLVKKKKTSNFHTSPAGCAGLEFMENSLLGFLHVFSTELQIPPWSSSRCPRIRCLSRWHRR